MSTPPLTPEQEVEALELATSGYAVQKIRDAILVTAKAFSNHLKLSPDFARLYASARQEGLEEIADTLLTVHEDELDHHRARLKSENLKWVLSKRKPLVYGDRLDVNVTQTVDVSTALIEARARALRIVANEGPEIIEHKKIDDDPMS